MRPPMWPTTRPSQRPPALRLMRHALCLAVLAGALALPAAAAVSYRLNDPALAARIDGVPVTAFCVDALWRLARVKEPQTARTTVLEEMVLNRLLAGAARARFDEAQLYAGQRVGFTREV